MNSANAGLVYWQNFDGGNGTADVGTGNLGTTNNGTGNTFFDAAGGVSGGSYNATSNIPSANSATNNGIASTTSAGGSALSALPNSGTLNQFTVSFWFKIQTQAGSNRAPRLLLLGEPPTADVQGPNSIGFAQIANGATVAGSATKIGPYFGPTDLTGAAGVGATNSVNEWTFIALTYDGTSSFGNDSAIQNAATGSSINGQFYRGTDTGSVVRTDLPISVAPNASSPSDPNAASLGPLNLGTSTVLHLGNRTSLSRGLDGWMDDVRIYDSVLTPTEIENIRLAGLQGLEVIPEPSTYALMGLGLVGLALIRKRSQ